MPHYSDRKPVVSSDRVIVWTHLVHAIAVCQHEKEPVKQPDHTQKLPHGKQKIEHGNIVHFELQQM